MIMRITGVLVAIICWPVTLVLLGAIVLPWLLWLCLGLCTEVETDDE